MPHSIATTHVGSLPRPQELMDLLFAKDNGQTVDRKVLQDCLSQAVNQVVREQVKVGIDEVSDGEMSKISYATYVKERFFGFEGKDIRYPPPADLEEVPNLMADMQKNAPDIKFKAPCCVGEIVPKDESLLEEDLARFSLAVQKYSPQSAFMNSASPGVIALFLQNQFYKTHEKYLEALVVAMKKEFEGIVRAGFELQVDCPDLAVASHVFFKNNKKKFLYRVDENIHALNASLENIPAEKIRMHICWGNYVGPHHHDVPLKEILPSLYRAKPRKLLIEAMNVRHAHEWEVLREIPLPPDKILVPGFLDSKSPMIEHPRLIAQQILRYARVVGPERLLAGTDCGFGTFAGRYLVHPDIVWKKFEALVEGAKLASQKL